MAIDRPKAIPKVTQCKNQVEMMIRSNMKTISDTALTAQGDTGNKRLG